MQHKVTRFAAIALVALAALLALAAFVVSNRDKAPTANAVSQRLAAPELPVVVAARPLVAGTPLQVDDVKAELRPYAPSGSYDDASILIGQVPLRDIAPGATLFRADLARGLSLQLRPGERAIAVPVDELAGAGNRIQPGEIVDVFMNLQNGRGDEERSQARLLLPRLRVLSYGSEDLARAEDEQTPRDADTSTSRTDATDPTHTDARTSTTPRRSVAARSGNSDSRSSSGGSNAQPRSAVLAVPLQDANRLLLGAQRGKLFLALRHPGDPTAPDAALFPEPKPVLTARSSLSQDQREALARPENAAYAGLDLDGLAGQAPRPEPAMRQPRAVPRAPLEIIRGSHR